MLPDGWSERTLNDVADLNMGQSPPSSDCNEVGLGLPFFQGNGEFGDKHPVAKRWIETPLKIADTGDILMSVRAPVGEVNIADTKSCIGRGLAAIKARNIDPAFLFQSLLNAKAVLAKKSQGSTFEAINKSDLKSYELVVPPLPEQKRIAEVLGSVDTAIEVTKSVIDQTKAVKQGLLQTLLSRGVRHTKFKDSPIGEIPYSWEINPLSELTHVITSGSRGWAQYYAESGALFVRITNLKRESVRLNMDDCVFVRLPENASEGTRTRLQTDDVLISITADLGITAHITDINEIGEAYINQHIALVRPRKAIINPTFLANYISSDIGQKQLGLMNDSGTKAGLNLSSISRLNIARPPLDEQAEIGKIITEVDEQVIAEKRKLAHLQTLKMGLMKDLLTGKVRVDSLKVKTANNVIPFAAKAVLKQTPEFALIPSADEHYLDALLAAEINSQLYGTPTFGSVKLEKILDITVRKLGFDEKIDRTAYQHAAGPYDAKARYKREEIFKQQGWFSVVKVADEAVRYPPTVKASAYKADFETYFGYARSEIDRIISLFRQRDTDQCEIAATAYAIWNDFMIDKRSFDDDMIVHEFRYNWHPSKERFTPTQVRDGLKWLRDNKLEPTGNGRKTKKLKGKA